MPRYRALIGNLPVRGETFTTHANSRRRDHTVFRFRRRQFHLTRTEESFPVDGLLREYIFRLLGYVGPYRNFVDVEVRLNRRYGG